MNHPLEEVELIQREDSGNQKFFENPLYSSKESRKDKSHLVKKTVQYTFKNKFGLTCVLIEHRKMLASYWLL